jgi:hypothetical protein
VGLDGFPGDPEESGDSAGRLALGDQPQHIPFPLSEVVSGPYAAGLAAYGVPAQRPSDSTEEDNMSGFGGEFFRLQERRDGLLRVGSVGAEGKQAADLLAASHGVPGLGCLREVNGPTRVGVYGVPCGEGGLHRGDG